MPIRVRVEVVGYYDQYPDRVIHDFKIERTDTLNEVGERLYEVGDKQVWHKNGDGVETLVTKALMMEET